MYSQDNPPTLDDIEGMLKVMLQMNGIKDWQFQVHRSYNRDTIQVILHTTVEIPGYDLYVAKDPAMIVANKLFPVIDELKKIEDSKI